MANHKAINRRIWEDLDYHNPLVLLGSYRILEIHEVQRGIPDKQRTRKGNKYRQFNELREGCLFAIGYQALNQLEQIEVAWANDHLDADVIFRIGGKDGEYIPVQLKSVPSERTNEKCVLQNVLNAVAKDLVDSADTLLGIYISRNIEAGFEFIIPPELKVRGMHFFAGIEPTAWHFVITGDLLSETEPRQAFFSHPCPEGMEIPPPPFNVEGKYKAHLEMPTEDQASSREWRFHDPRRSPSPRPHHR